jgi:predicted Zn-dependent protease
MLRAPDETTVRARSASIPPPSAIPASGTGRTQIPTVTPAATPAAPMPPLAPPAPAASNPALPRVGTDDVVRFAPGSIEQRTPTGVRAREFADQRTPSDPSLPRTGTGPAMARVSTNNAVAAETAFKRGELAMKRDQPGEAILEFKTACELNPSDVDYAAMLGWAKFCAAGDKAAIGADTRKLLERAVFKSQRPERARFYLGRVERMLGRDKEALRHFQEVLEIKANHAEALGEIRAIEARIAAGKPGLFGRKR